MKLGDLVNIQTGKLDVNAQVINGKYPFFTCAKEPVKIDTYSFDCECVLVAGNGDLNVKHYSGKFDAYQRTYVIEVKQKDKLYTRFLFHFLNKYVEKLRNQSIGGVIKYIKMENLTDIVIPDKTIDEQKRIVALLDQADSLRQKRKEQIQLLDDFLKSKFLEMFGDPLANPKSIRQERIGDVGSVITGNTPSRQNKDYYGHYLEWIKSDNINTPQFILTQASEYLSQKGTTVCRIAPTGSVLVTCIAGSPDCIGNSAMANRDVAFNQQINAFLPGKEVLQEFFFSQLLVCKRLIQQASSEGMKGLVSKSKFSNIKILMPSVDQQRIFVGTFRSVANIRDLLQSGILQLDNSYQALMQQFF